MRLQTVWACAGSFAIAALAGCNGSIGEIPTGTGGTTGAGTGTAGTGSGTAGSGAGGSGNLTGTAGSSPTGTAGTGAPSSSTIDFSGTPKYYRAIRLSNSQWAGAVQT